MGLNKKTQDFLSKIGIKEYSDSELRSFAKVLEGEVDEAWTNPTGLTGGMGIATPITPISPMEWKKVPDGTKVLACAFGGTNWLIAEAKKSGGKLVVGKLRQRFFENVTKRYNFADLINMMAEEIVSAVPEVRKLSALAISFALPQKNTIKDYGLDAELLSAIPGKFWEIPNFKPKQHFGKALLSVLKKKYQWKVRKVFVMNDINALLSSLTDIGSVGTNNRVCGFIFGTGINASEAEINYQIGRSLALPKDQILDFMASQKLVPTFEYGLEYFIGGDYLKARVHSALKLLAEGKLIKSPESTAKNILTSNDPGIISTLAKEDRGVVGKIARTVLTQAGQLAGMIIAVVVGHSGYKAGKLNIPVEGSVYWDGFGVKEAGEKSLNLLMPGSKIEIYKASSLAGAAKYAMVLSSI